MVNGEHPYGLRGQKPQSTTKLHGRAFYESIGSPKVIVAPMVDRSEFAWRMLSRSYHDSNPSNPPLLAYSPMLHSRLFTETKKFRDAHFQPVRLDSVSESDTSEVPWLDGNPAIDRPLFVQFCANKPDELLEAAIHVQDHCDAVDLNLGCPQGIARTGQYGAFLQEDWDKIYKLINNLHLGLSIPVTAKMRILESKERTLEYAKMILSAGASIITVHGRRRDQKGHNMGLADWSYIRYLRDNLPRDTVIFANGNILNRNDIQPCLDATGADAIMSAEGNLSDPAIFSTPPPLGTETREYWRGRNGEEGYRIDGVVRRYFDIIYQYVLDISPPQRQMLFIPGDPDFPRHAEVDLSQFESFQKTSKRDKASIIASPSLKAMQGHLFHLLRPILSTHTDIRDVLAKCRIAEMVGFEQVLSMLEAAVKAELLNYDNRAVHHEKVEVEGSEAIEASPVAAKDAMTQYKRPWWICQPYIRPLPEEAIKIGALTLSKKEKAKIVNEEKQTGTHQIILDDEVEDQCVSHATEIKPDLPRSALVCG